MALKYPPLGVAPISQAVRERRSGPARPRPEEEPAPPAATPEVPEPAPAPRIQTPHTQAPRIQAPRIQKPRGRTQQPQDTQVKPVTVPERAAEPNPVPPPHRPATRTFWQQYRVFLSIMLGALVLGGLAVASWFALPIRNVTVTGNHQLSSLEVKRLAGLDGSRPFGWLYYGPWRAGALRDNAWVQAAHITRRFPDTVTLTINERQPVAWLREASGELTALAADATPLPMTPLPMTQRPDATQPPLPVISGWGPDRSADALYAAGALSRYNVKSVEYTPTGITIQTAKGTIWSGDRELLLKYAGAIENQSEGSRINLYPWGVSVQK